MDSGRAAEAAEGRSPHDTDTVRVARPAPSRVRIVRRRALDRLEVVTPAEPPERDEAPTTTAVASAWDAWREGP